MKHLYLFAIALLWLPHVVTAQNSPEDRYITIYELIQEADSLNDNASSREALPKYKEAQQALKQFQTDYPAWQTKIVKFRLNYLVSKISPLESKVADETPPESGAVKTVAGSAESDDQIKALQERLRQAQADKAGLEKQIRDISANPRPVSTDTQALAQAQEKIRTLQQDNDHLKSTLKQQPFGPDAELMERTGRVLADAKAKLAEQAKLVGTLTEQNEALHKRLETVTAAPAGSNQFASLQQQFREVEADRNALQSQLKAAQSRAAGGSDQLSKAQESINKLQKENSLLRASLEQRPGQTISTTDSFTAEQNKQTLAKLNKQLEEQSGQITNLIHEKEALQKRLDSVVSMNGVAKELIDAKESLDNLQNRYDLQTKAAIALMAEYKSKIRQQGKASENLTRQLENLKKQMSESASNAELVTVLRAENEILKKQVADLKAHPPASEELIAAQAQVASYRARLDILEARAIPYTAEELALLKPGSPALAASGTAKGPHGLPPASAELVIEAQRLFAAHQLKEAEDKYQQVLQLDTNNVFTLANLATIQIESENYVAAETNLRKAMELDSKDAFTLGVWGNMLYRQGRIDAAFDVLSRAAQIDPNSPEIQNMLGITLSHKGQRGAAETALRRALQIDPSYANAHNNLAVIYITQEPPLTELARWHYQKALALGSARNPDLEKLLATSPAETKK